MKFIINDKRTKEALKAWSPPKDPIILSFFFWLHGAPMQSNLYGLLSSLLHQLLKGYAPVTNLLLRNDTSLREKVYVQDWDVQGLPELLRLLHGTWQRVRLHAFFWMAWTNTSRKPILTNSWN
jgi:hypothetical protein